MDRNFILCTIEDARKEFQQGGEISNSAENLLDVATYLSGDTITKVYIVQKIEHLDMNPSIIGNVVALSEEEVEFIRSNWDDEGWGRYCEVIEVKRDLRYLQRHKILEEK